MAGHRAKTKSSANRLASRMRRRGFNASVFKKKRGYGVSVSRR
jgi:hypothetical protein